MAEEKSGEPQEESEAAPIEKPEKTIDSRYQYLVGINETKIFTLKSDKSRSYLLRHTNIFKYLEVNQSIGYWENNLTDDYLLKGVYLSLGINYLFETQTAYFKPYAGAGIALHELFIKMNGLDGAYSDPASKGMNVNIGSYFPITDHISLQGEYEYIHTDNIELRYHKYSDKKYLEQQNVFAGISINL
ncbi:MAG: outer membrane beta-barrel protein [Oligoflexales bacterium]|nr:outer membrane beta-barrel protein [Oligoflexales bacterium]